MRTDRARVPHPGRRVPAAIACVAALLVLTSCTGGRTPTTTPVTPIPGTQAGAGGSPSSGATGSPDTADMPSVGTDPAPTSGGTPTTALGTDQGPALAPVDLGQSDAAEAALEKAAPGLYGLTDIGAALSGRTLRISAPGDCGFVLDVLRAGQWALDVLDSPHGDSGTWIAAMTLGDRTGLLVLDDSTYACSGSLALDRPEPITVSGASTASGTASFLPLTCGPVLDSDSDTPTSYTLIGLYALPKASYLVFGDMPATQGGHPLDPDADQTVSVSELGADQRSLAGLNKLLVGLLDPINAQADGDSTWEQLFGAHSWTSQVDDAADETAQATITSTTPFTGTFTAKKLANPDTPSSTVAVSLGFSCDS